MESFYRTANHQSAASSSQSESFYSQPVTSHSAGIYSNEPTTYVSSQLSQLGYPPFIHDTSPVAYDDALESPSSRLSNQQLSPSVSAPEGLTQYSAVCAPTVEVPRVSQDVSPTHQSEDRTAPRPRKRSRTNASDLGSRDRLITCSIAPCQSTNGSFASPYLHGRHVANDHMPQHCTDLRDDALSDWLESQSMSAKARSTALKAFRQRQVDEQAGMLSCARCSRTFARKDACKKHVARSSCFPASSSSSSRKSSSVARRQPPPASTTSFLSGGGSISRRSTLSSNASTVVSPTVKIMDLV
ncbi:hypothetical protein BKA62DRAFT_188952 [Auriculariales sp. MPI-PUGE-AT-0066]|nr:hypothetical protein BKA62DRAFT_188952 [Auriculariales sp. MPI-PUGE-AT-0066]